MSTFVSIIWHKMHSENVLIWNFNHNLACFFPKHVCWSISVGEMANLFRSWVLLVQRPDVANPTKRGHGSPLDPMALVHGATGAMQFLGPFWGARCGSKTTRFLCLERLFTGLPSWQINRTVENGNISGFQATEPCFFNGFGRWRFLTSRDVIICQGKFIALRGVLEDHHLERVDFARRTPMKVALACEAWNQKNVGNVMNNQFLSWKKGLCSVYLCLFCLGLGSFLQRFWESKQFWGRWSYDLELPVLDPMRSLCKSQSFAYASEAVATSIITYLLYKAGINEENLSQSPPTSSRKLALGESVGLV